MSAFQLRSGACHSMVRGLALLALLLCASSLLTTSADAVVLFVDRSATGAGNGMSWADAFTDLQSAVDAAGAWGGGEIWVKAGTYNTLQPVPVSDSFEAKNPNAVDIIGEEMDCKYTSNGTKKGDHLTVLYLSGSLTTSPPAATFGSTTDQDSLAVRLAALTQRSDILVFMNHPSVYDLTKEDLLPAVNANALHGMELLWAEDVAKWDYLLANLDDQAGDCSKILWAVRSNDQHSVASVDHLKNRVQVGIIPTPAQDPVYADRRLAFKDMVRRGSLMAVQDHIRCDMPTYDFVTSPNGAPGLRVNVRLHDMPGAMRSELRFYGCDWATGTVPGTLLRTIPLYLNQANSSTYYLTDTGLETGMPLTAQQRANIKYIRVELLVTSRYSAPLAYFQPVRIRADGSWWNGPAYTLAGRHAVVGSSPYPAGGTDSGETVYFDPHTHTLHSDGNASPGVMRHKYWTNYGQIDPSKPRFCIITDHNRRTPFAGAVRSVVTLREGVRLYGGFAGTETSRNQRNPVANVTIIDAQDAGRCVYADGSEWTVKTGSLVDGFTIKRGKVTNGDGAGLYALSCSPVVSNCSFAGNNAGYGAGVLIYGPATITDCTFSSNNAAVAGGALVNAASTSPVITGCSFAGNTSRKGAAICNPGCTPQISRCSFTGNTCTSAGGLEGGGALYFRDASGSVTNCIISGNTVIGGNGAGAAAVLFGVASPLIANNTIVGNSATLGGGINVRESCKPRIANNIIAFNSSGILQAASASAVLVGNCLHANTQYDYSGASAGPGDISKDPLFVNRTAGNLRLRPESPCIDAASNADAPLTDMEGRGRPFDGNSDGTAVCDIGAYEYRWLFVDRDAPGPVHDGASWTKAFRTIQEALNASVGHDQVWVAEGTYPERIALKSGVALYGGFEGTESKLDQRDWAGNPTTIDGQSGGTVVAIPSGCDSETRLDGFTIRGGDAFQGGGVCVSSSSPVVTNNTITGNSALYGGGIYCYSSPGTTISGNILVGNTASIGAGLFCSASAGLRVTNNTICSNIATADGGGVLASSSPSTFSNNIIAFNSSGIRSFSDQDLRHNCVYGNIVYNYHGVAPGVKDISVDPSFVNRQTGDYHLIVGSPCADVGTTNAPGLPLFDIDGDGRVFGMGIDIGADEVWPGSLYVWDAKRAGDGTTLSFHGGVATAVFGDSFYVQSTIRACGIRVDKSQYGITPGTVVYVEGTVGTDSNGERYVAATLVSPVGTAVVRPMTVPHKYLGGGDWFYNAAAGVGQRGIKGAAGLNNTCLLVRTVGRVTSLGAGCMYVDDGCHILDGTSTSGVANVGVRVLCDPTGHEVGDLLAVTGISSTMARDGYLQRLLRATEITPIE